MKVKQVMPKTEQEKKDFARLQELVQQRIGEIPKPGQVPTTQFAHTIVELQANRITWQQALKDIERLQPQSKKGETDEK